MICTLIGNSNNACPLWRTLARTANAVVTDCTVEETQVDQNRGCRIGIVGNVGYAAPTSQECLIRCRQIVLLVVRLLKDLTYPTTCISGTLVPYGFRLVPPTAVTQGDDAGKMTVGKG